MKREPQIQAEVTIDARLETVWEYNLDISRIPEFHPRVSKVDLLSGTRRRENGVEYRCNVTEGRGKGTCVEKILDVVPMERFTTIIPEDSWGLTKMFESYVVDTVFSSVGDDKTKIEIRHYYEPKTVKAKLVNPLARGKLKRQTADTLYAIKSAIERQQAGANRQ